MLLQISEEGIRQISSRSTNQNNNWEGFLQAYNYCETQKTREHMKHFRNVDCVVTNHNNVQDMQANLKISN